MINISTGGYFNRPASEVCKDLLENDITDIELSGGIYSDSLMESLISLKSNISFQVHNYFPPSSHPFVLNLASLDETVSSRTLAHMKNSIELASILGAKKYSFHAGFLLDPKVDELGKRIPNKNLFARDIATEVFIKKVIELSDYAKNLGISLMIENNVLSQKNRFEFDENPFLMADPKECEQIFQYLPENISLLIDVAHLKISANSLKFNPELFFELMDSRVGGYHLSDNNGLSDTNHKFNDVAWFWPFIKPDVNYYTIEVYNESYETLKALVSLTYRKIYSL